MNVATETNAEKELTLKQKFLLYYFKTKEYLNYVKHLTIQKIKKIVDSVYFYLISFAALEFLLHKSLTHLDLTVLENNIYSFAFATAGIIGASIAIIFSFSTFILQSTADLFSTQYLNKFIEDTKEKLFFWLLVFLTIASFFIPIFFEKNALEILFVTLLLAFYIIYFLYKELRKRINPETTLKKIKSDAIKQLERVNKELKKRAHIQEKIFDYKGESKDFSLDFQYRSNNNWHIVILENVKYLFEIGLRLLAKNEINSFNLTIVYIRNIYIKHLDLRNGHFIRTLASFWGTYSFNDEGFTTRILEYLQSIGDRIIQEKRKENIYHLLKIYEDIIIYSLSVTYADKNLGAYKENPLLNLLLSYYIGFIEKLLIHKEVDWDWESIKSISRISNAILQKTDHHFALDQINEILYKISLSRFRAKENSETFLKEIVNIYLNQIRIAWYKYDDEIFWRRLFAELKKNTLLLSASSDINLSVSELFINFCAWQGNVANWISENKKDQKENLDKFEKLIDRWSDFLLDLARDIGLENRHLGLPIIQSVDSNLRIITWMKNRYQDRNLEEVYRTQFNTLSWYFEKTEKVENSFLPNMEHVLEILLSEISRNLKNNTFDSKNSIEQYIELIEQHFNKATSGSRYNHPRVVEKLVYLGLLLHKYKKTDIEAAVLSKIDQLNQKYLADNKEYFEMKQKRKGIMGPDVFQLCIEIHDLENDLFSHDNHLRGINYILKNEISKEDWDSFIQKIGYCKNVKITTRTHF